MKIEVVGTGCPTCKKLYELTVKAAELIGDDVTVEYTSEAAGMKRLMELGLMSSPAVVVNGNVAMVGFQPNVESIKNRILEALKQ